MSNQLMRKECKICGTRFGQEITLCRNCGSADTKLVVQENLGLPETVSERNREVGQIGLGRKRVKKKVVLVSVIVGISLLLVVGFQLLLRWADKTVQRERWEIEETVKMVIQYDGEMSNEKWKEKIFPLLDELYSWQMDDELVDMFEHAGAEYRPIYEWEHYLYVSCLVDFYTVKGIWEYEQTGEELKDFHYTELLYYYLEYMDFEEHTGLSAEEKERLQRYVTNLRMDVTERFNLTKQEWEQLYADATAEYGYIDYFKLEEFWKERTGFMLDESLEESLKRAENLYGTDWQDEIFPLLNQLYDQNQYKMLYDVYAEIKAQDINKPISQWEHYLFIRALYEIYDIEKVLDGEAAGEQIKEWQYVNILLDYFDFADFENRTNLSEEEKAKLLPFVSKLREDAKTRWNLSEQEQEELRKSIVSEYNEVIYEEAERYVESWMEKNGYVNDGDTFEAEMINSEDMDDDAWKERFYPKLDQMYEQGLDEELYIACTSVYRYSRMLVGWQHEDYFEMLGEYYSAEDIWREEENGVELVDYHYTQLLYSYLVFERWETNMSLSLDEMERLKPYREKILQDGATRWEFTEEEWRQITEATTFNGGYVYYYEVSNFIAQWMENK